jgi:single-strand DNA-binding protein
MFQFHIEGAPTNTNTSGESTGSKVDWDGRREYLVANCGTAEKAESTIAIVSAIVDCGLQPQEDAKMEWKGTDAQKSEIEAKGVAGQTKEYFEVLPNDNKVPTLYKRWPVNATQSFAVFVDIPSVQLNQSKFFGEDDGESHPLRMLLNNEYYQQGVGKIVNKGGYIVKEKNHSTTGGKQYGLAKTNTLHKLADATDNLNEDKLFKPQQLGALLGKAVLVEYQVNETESKGKKYLNEKVSLKGQVPGMMKAMIPTLDPKYIFGVSFKGEQDEAVLKQLRQSVITTMQQATNFKGSTLEAALVKLGRVKASEGNSEGEQKEPEPQPRQLAPQQSTPQPAPDFDSFDDDIPF